MAILFSNGTAIDLTSALLDGDRQPSCTADPLGLAAS